MTKTIKHFHPKIKTKTKSKMPAKINTVPIASTLWHSIQVPIWKGTSRNVYASWFSKKGNETLYISLPCLGLACTSHSDKRVDDVYCRCLFKLMGRGITTRGWEWPNTMSFLRGPHSKFCAVGPESIHICTLIFAHIICILHSHILQQSCATALF